jgi:hypothetical protein
MLEVASCFKCSEQAPRARALYRTCARVSERLKGSSRIQTSRIR